jgi:hypothetical protein
MSRASSKLSRGWHVVTAAEREELTSRGISLFHNSRQLVGTMRGRSNGHANGGDPLTAVRRIREDAKAIANTVAMVHDRLRAPTGAAAPPQLRPPTKDDTPFSVLDGSEHDFGHTAVPEAVIVDLFGPSATANADEHHFTLAYDQLLIGGEENDSWWLNTLAPGNVVHLLSRGGWPTRVVVRREPEQHHFTVAVAPEPPTNLPTLEAANG